MEPRSRREFIKIAGTVVLVTSGISVFSLVSAQSGIGVASEGDTTDSFTDGYYTDGYYFDGYLTGFNEIPHDSLKLVAAPNPSNGNFELWIDTKTHGACTIVINDLSGKMLVQHNHLLQEGTNRISFQSGTLPHGIYELRVITENGSGSLRLMIMQ